MSGKTVKEKESNKTLHNYLILITIFIICIGFVLYLCKWYQVYETYQKETPVIRDSLQEIVNDELEHYVVDNPTTVIYMCTATDDVCRSFERDFKKLLKKKNYYDQIVYLNLTDLDQESFVQLFNERYSYKTPLTTHYPAFVLFEDGKITSVLQGNEKRALTVTMVKQFLELNDIGE